MRSRYSCALALVLLALCVAAPVRAEIWLTAGEILTLANSGASNTSWGQLKSDADQDIGSVCRLNFGGNCDTTSASGNCPDTFALADALVYIRTGEQSHRDDALACLASLIDPNNPIATGSNNSVLGASRNLFQYVIAADYLLTEGTNPSRTAFQAWVQSALDKEYGGDDPDRETITLLSTRSPRNWGCMAIASRIIGGLFVGGTDDAHFVEGHAALAEWLGEEWGHGFFLADGEWDSGNCTWAAEAGGTSSACTQECTQDTNDFECPPAPLNPVGATLQTTGPTCRWDVDGVAAEDQQRNEGCPSEPSPNNFTAPAWCDQDYVYECMGALLAATWAVERAGFPGASRYGESGLRRMIEWQTRDEDTACDNSAPYGPHGNDYPPEGNDLAINPLINCLYPYKNYPADPNSDIGRAVHYTDWMFPADPNSGNDSDGDAVVNWCDNCPQSSNSAQSDTDDDGVGDACDICNGAPTGSGDTDGDGVDDDEDNCSCIANAKPGGTRPSWQT